MVERLAPRLMSWASMIDARTRAQAETTASLPFIRPYIALMPDAHLGRGATVGSVIPTKRAIIPAAVGVDIGCGMIAVRTQLVVDDLPEDRRSLREAIERSIPLSAGKANERITSTAAARIGRLEELAAEAAFDPSSYSQSWKQQLGSLGSGNHFIEVTVDEESRVWLFLHSGSRGVGNAIARHHIAVAKGLAEQWWIPLPDPDLAYLVEGTAAFDRYITELRWAQTFALLNREEMMDRVVAAFEQWTGSPVHASERINCHHNYTAQERHFDHDVWLSRKGAIDASAGTPGLIPGSMGTASFVVVGKGNGGALNSAPHGAGRSHSRTSARRTFTMEQLTEAMTGIEWRRTASFLDEIPAAYKPIDQVMADAADLVEVRHVLHQIINVKGD